MSIIPGPFLCYPVWIYSSWYHKSERLWIIDNKDAFVNHFKFHFRKDFKSILWNLYQYQDCTSNILIQNVTYLQLCKKSQYSFHAGTLSVKWVRPYACEPPSIFILLFFLLWTHYYHDHPVISHQACWSQSCDSYWIYCQNAKCVFEVVCCGEKSHSILRLLWIHHASGKYVILFISIRFFLHCICSIPKYVLWRYLTHILYGNV